MRIVEADPRRTAYQPLLAGSDAALAEAMPAGTCQPAGLADLTQPETDFFVAEEAGHPVACAALVRHDGYAEIKRLYTRPSHVRRGIGTALMVALERRARANGCAALRLETGHALTAAVALYTARGYRPCPPFAAHTAHPARLFLEKRLAPASVRRGTPDEAAGLLAASHALMNSLFPAEANHYLDADTLAGPDIRFVVGEIDHQVAGCGALALRSGYGEIKSMFVAQEARGAGLAAALLDHLEHLARDHGLPLLRLETGDRLDAARRLYMRHGFQLRGPYGDYPDGPHNVFMEKTLAAEPVGERA